MSKAHKMAKRMQRLEDTHRRDMVRLKGELLSAMTTMLDEVRLSRVDEDGYLLLPWKAEPKMTGRKA